MRSMLRRTFGLGVALSATGLWAAPAKPAAKAPTPVVDEAPSDTANKIEGLEIARAGGGYLGLEIVNNNFVLSFYDAKKVKASPDVVRATIRWLVRYQPNDERAVLNLSADGLTLSSAKTVKYPHSFKFFLSLFADDGEKAAESYTLDYHE